MVSEGSSQSASERQSGPKPPQLTPTFVQWDGLDARLALDPVPIGPLPHYMVGDDWWSLGPTQ